MKHLRTFVAGIVGLLASAAHSHAQVFFEPIQYQYGPQRPVYYGGSDPAVLQRAAMPVDAAGRFGRVNGYAFTSGDLQRHREVVTEPVRVFTDAIPGRNAALYGFTIDDARNEAYTNAPRYFKKSDQLATAEVAADGTLVVPAQPRRYRAPVAIVISPRTTTAPTTRPAPVMVLPKPQKPSTPLDGVVDARF